ncbi:MAG TPA: pyridoxal-phosphate dependent enzyme, partial [Candidatus Handelsmanbacteria bacterium]|nr:pyridoxal-phosphate dependent enzyme [Candidatus Handelsmanbacteria bacterium]
MGWSFLRAVRSKASITRAVQLASASAMRCAQRSAREDGISAGISAGATLHAGLKEAERLEEGTIVVMFSDGG